MLTDFGAKITNFIIEHKKNKKKKQTTTEQ